MSFAETIDIISQEITEIENILQQYQMQLEQEEIPIQFSRITGTIIGLSISLNSLHKIKDSFVEEYIKINELATNNKGKKKK